MFICASCKPGYTPLIKTTISGREFIVPLYFYTILASNGTNTTVDYSTLEMLGLVTIAENLSKD